MKIELFYSFKVNINTAKHKNKYCFSEANFLIAFSTSKDGNLSYKYGNKKQVDQNRSDFFDKVGITPSRLEIIRPTNSSAVVVKDKPASRGKVYSQTIIVDSDFKGHKTGIDGCLTFGQGYVGLLSGDCVPLLLWHHKSNLHGVIHVGLLGIVNNIVDNLEHIFDKYQINPAEVNYFLGPAIHQDSYNLKQSHLWKGIQNDVLRKKPEFENHISKNNGCYNLNLHQAVAEQLTKLGSAQEKIQYHPDNTADPNSVFYSHCYAKLNNLPEGRFMSVIGPNIKSP